MSCNGENFIVSKQVAFRLLALAVSHPVKTEITLYNPECSIMEGSLVLIVFSVNAGKIINTRREVVVAVSLMLFKSLISLVHPETAWNKGKFPRLFNFLSGSLFSTDFRDRRWKALLEQSNLDFFTVCI